MDRFIHPNLNDVPLASVLHALSDPTRLEIVRRLGENLECTGDGLACSFAAPDGLPRATMSNHFTILRTAGLIESRKRRVVIVDGDALAEHASRLTGLTMDGQTAI